MEHRLGVATAAAVIALSLTGCYSYTVRSGAMAAGPPTRETGVTLVHGLVGTSATAPECRNGLAYVETWTPWWAGFVQWLTFGIVSPLKAEWACAGAETGAKAPAPGLAASTRSAAESGGPLHRQTLALRRRPLTRGQQR